VNFLYPKIARHHLILMLKLTLGGASIAGLYGIAHDQITYTLGPEYFTLLKFHQFAWANLGLPPRLHAAEIGFLATWWAGAIATWALARLAVPTWPAREAARHVWKGIAIIFVFTLASGITGFLLGQARKSNPDFSNWDAYLLPLRIQAPENFVLVAYIHNASYLGGFIGLIVAWIWLAWQRRATKRNRGAVPS